VASSTGAMKKIEQTWRNAARAASCCLHSRSLDIFRCNNKAGSLWIWRGALSRMAKADRPTKALFATVSTTLVVNYYRKVIERTA